MIGWHTSPWAQDRFIYGSSFFSWPHFGVWDWLQFPFPFVKLFTFFKQSARRFLIPSPWPPTVPSSFFMAPSSGHTRFSFYLLVPTALAACLRFLHKIHNTQLNKERWNATIGICVRKLRVLLSCSSPYSVVSKCSKALFAWASWPSGIAQDVLLNVWKALANHASTLQYRSQHGCGQALGLYVKLAV